MKQNNFSTTTIIDWFNSIITVANNTGVGSLETQSLLFIFNYFQQNLGTQVLPGIDTMTTIKPKKSLNI